MKLILKIEIIHKKEIYSSGTYSWKCSRPYKKMKKKKNHFTLLTWNFSDDTSTWTAVVLAGFVDADSIILYSHINYYHVEIIFNLPPTCFFNEISSNLKYYLIIWHKWHLVAKVVISFRKYDIPSLFSSTKCGGR